MYGILGDKYVTYNKDGGVTAKTTGHVIEINANGDFTISTRSGEKFLTKQK